MKERPTFIDHTIVKYLMDIHFCNFFAKHIFLFVKYFKL